MSIDDLGTKYLQLRSALASAYGEPVWDSGHIDSLTDQIASTEYALAASGVDAVPVRPITSRGPAQAAVGAGARA